MKIGIVSDTHGNAANFRKVVDWLNKQNIKMLLHAGDIGSAESLKESLQGYDGKLLGVLGNMDDGLNNSVDYYNKISNVKIEKYVLETEISGKRIAITHFPQEAKKLAESGKYDFVFYGHTHKAWEELVNNCRMINPGELAGHFYKPTFAVYDTEANKLELKILEKL